MVAREREYLHIGLCYQIDLIYNHYGNIPIGKSVNALSGRIQLKRACPVYWATLFQRLVSQIK